LYDVLIIGCGITGAAAAYTLAKYRLPDRLLRVAVLERENDVADGTTKANSAILHAGYDPLPGTLMAKLNVEGSRLAKEICRELDVPYRQTGSLVLALSREELPVLQALYERGKANGVEDLSLLSGEEAQAMEPQINPDTAGALFAPTAAIVNPWEYALAMAEAAVQGGAELFLESEAASISPAEEGYLVETRDGRRFFARRILNAAGVWAEQVHNLISAPAFRIQPNRGEYYLLDKSEGNRTSRILFQCPTKAGKGVLVAPTVHGNLLAGPNAENIPEGDDTATTSRGLADVAARAKRTLPGLNLRESIRNFAGVRAQCLRLDGEPTGDFYLRQAGDAPGFFDLAGIMSPGLTAAPAVARYAVEMLKESGLSLVPREDFTPTRRRIRFKELPPQEKNRLIAADPRYGQIVCRCETITEGEIAAALHTPIPARTIDGVKRRAGAGMGRCQGGFCGPRVLEIISRELGIPPTEILQDKAGSRILLRETKSEEGGDRD